MPSSFRAPGSTFGNYPGALFFPSVVETYAPSAAGDTAAAAVASSRYAQPRTTLLVTPAAGAGAYTYVIYFATTNRIAGDSVVVKYTAPASTNPTIEFRNATSAGTLLLTANPAASFVGQAEFIYTGSAWVLLTQGPIVATLGSVTSGAGSFTTLAASSTLAVTGAATLSAAATVGTTLGVTGLSTLTGGLAGGTQALSGAGAVNLTTLTTKLTSSGVAQALTLANGADGQIKTLIHDVDGGSMVLTPTTKTGYTTITFTNVGESATLQYVTTRGWIILALNGAVAA